MERRIRRRVEMIPRIIAAIETKRPADTLTEDEHRILHFLDMQKTATIQKKIEANPFARNAKNKKPRILTITQSTYDGILYNVEEIKDIIIQDSE